METQKILKILNVISWLIFSLLCIQSGVFLFNAFYTLSINPVDTKYFQRGEIDFSNLYGYGARHFFTETFMMTLVSSVKAYLFYLIILILKALNLFKPFSKEVGSYIFRISYTALLIAVLSWAGIQYSEWLVAQGVKLPLMYKYFGGDDVFLMMGVMLFIIGQLFKRGIEIQSENELTV